MFGFKELRFTTFEKEEMPTRYRTHSVRKRAERLFHADFIEPGFFETDWANDLSWAF